MITSAGDRLYDKRIKRVMKFLKENHRKIKLYDIYGQTETVSVHLLLFCILQRISNDIRQRALRFPLAAT